MSTTLAFGSNSPDAMVGAMFDPLSPEEWSALLLTLRVAGTATLFTLPIAVLIGYSLAGRPALWRDGLSLIVHLPLVLPPVVTGYMLLVWFGRRGMIGAPLDHWFGIVLAFRWTGAALASAVMALPLMVRPIRQSFESLDHGLLEAAKTLGASPLIVFVTIILPLSLPGILTAMIIGFAKAVGEFGATATFVGNIPDETRTLALAIYTLSQSPGEDHATFRLVILSIVLAVGAVGISEILHRRVTRVLGGRDA